ncbi:MAG: TetR family transcriptional regulator [Actinobacteria bacterium]|nr:TetR family transcriptional regulator [Actinomycetota bacterium]
MSDQNGPALSRDAVVDRALALADAEGLDAVTIRRLGQDFGVTPMALYWHVRNKDELLEAMGDALFADVDTSFDEGGSWADQLGVLLERLVAALRAHPGSVELAFPRILANEIGLVLTETALRLLREGGFTVRQGADIAAQALRTAVTLVSTEPGANVGEDPEIHEQLMAAKRQAIASLPRDRYPNLVDSEDALFACEDAEVYYDSGIELFMAGVIATAGLAGRSERSRTAKTSTRSSRPA